MTFQHDRQRFPPRTGGFPPSRDPTRQAPSLDPNYLKDGYFDQKRNLLPEVIQKWPEERAKALRREQPKLTSTQLRRFFNRARILERQLKSGKPFDRLKEEILNLKVIAVAAAGRGTAPELFKQIMERNVELAVQSEDAFMRGFLTHMQSLVAYLKYEEEREKRR